MCYRSMFHNPRAAVSGHFPLTGSHWGLGGQLLSASWGRGVRAEEIAGPSPCPATLDKGRDAGIHSSCGHRKLGPLRDSSSATESLESQQWSACRGGKSLLPLLMLPASSGKEVGVAHVCQG